MKSLDDGSAWIRSLAMCVVALTSWTEVSAQIRPSVGRFVDEAFHDDTGEHKYVVFVPAGYRSDVASPAILFLHGAGERGRDNRLQLTVGLAPFIQARAKTFPFLVIFPQCELTEGRILESWYADHSDGRRALNALDDARQRYNFDAKGVVLTGWSMGGFGAWNLGMSEPSRWSAVLPVSGGGEVASIAALKGIPVWALHGAKDTIVKPDDDHKLVDALKEAGGTATFTEIPDGMHDITSTVYGNDALVAWMLDPHKNPSDLGTATVTPVEVLKVPFVPAVEISKAVGLRLGNEVLDAFSYSIPQTVSPDFLRGRINDMFSSTVASGRQFSIRFSGISYAGLLERVVAKGYAKDRILVQLGIRKVALTIGGTSVSGERHSAQAGPITIWIGQHSPVWFSLELAPYIADRRIRLRVVSASFQIPNDNWSVSQPAGVSVQGFGMTQEAVASGLTSGLYGAKVRIENEIVAIAPRIVQEIEKSLTIPDSDTTMSNLWQLPFYTPRFHVWPEQISADENGLSLVAGLTVASIDSFGPAKPMNHFDPVDVSLEQLPSDKAMHVVFAPQVLGPLTEMFIESDQARLDLRDIPEPLFTGLAERGTMQEIIPDLNRYGDSVQIRSTMRIIRPLLVVNPEQPATGSKPIEFRLPDVRVVVSINTGVEKSKWQPCAMFDLNLSEQMRASLQKPDHDQRIVQVDWIPAADVTGVGRFAESYAVNDTTLKTDRYVELFNSAWAAYFAGLQGTSAKIPDVLIGLSKFRLFDVQSNATAIDITYNLAGIEISNLSNDPVTYQTKAPTSPWGEPLTLKPGASHEFEIPYPLTYRRTTTSGSEVYTLPVGSHSEFRTPVVGGPPRLFAARRR